MPRTTRRLTQWCGLAALVAVVLGVLGGPAVAQGGQSVSHGSVVVKVVDAPGCDRAPVHQDGAHPATPPRTGSAHDLAPALCGGAHAAATSRYLDAAAGTAPRRGPPAVPSSPVELSVLLRV
ncbi:hypothetical protein [Streptomyces sp. NPDC051561]|uniref:hypothetical protein n=1 Tax=Streptomyces sp. NPDC051561 TaxID=3365658 RepID=UPI0037AA45CC